MKRFLFKSGPQDFFELASPNDETLYITSENLFDHHNRLIEIDFKSLWKYANKFLPDRVYLKQFQKSIVIVDFSRGIPCTTKTLVATISGQPIVDYKWVSDSLTQNTILPMENYFYSQQRDISHLLSQYSFDISFLSNSLRPKEKLGGGMYPCTLSDLIIGCRGTFFSQTEEQKENGKTKVKLGYNRMFSRADFEDEKKQRGEQKVKMPENAAVDYRWVIDSIIHQEIKKFEDYIFDESKSHIHMEKTKQQKHRK